MNADILVSVSSGAVTVSVNTGSTNPEVRQALSLVLKVVKENTDSINEVNQQLGTKATEAVPSKARNDRQEVSKLMALNAEKLKIRQMAIVAVQVYGNQTRIQMRSNIENWGKRVGDNFSGGNFNRDLLKKILLREVGKTADGETLYGLTEKGKVEADKILEELGGITK